MNHRIKQWVSLFFDGLPYSEEAAQARARIESALEEKAPDAAPEELAAQYGSYEKLAETAGFSPEEAKEGGARVIATGRSDYPNQVNNVLAFPGVFRGTFDCRASDINEEMKMAAAQALSSLVSDEELNEDYILPKAFDPRVGRTVAAAVAEAARRTGVARI